MAILRILSIVALLVISLVHVSGLSCTTAQSGTWNSATTWICDGGIEIPTAQVDVNISSTHTVTLANGPDANGNFANSLYIEEGGTLFSNSASNSARKHLTVHTFALIEGSVNFRKEATLTVLQDLIVASVGSVYIFRPRFRPALTVHRSLVNRGGSVQTNGLTLVNSNQPGDRVIEGIFEGFDRNNEYLEFKNDNSITSSWKVSFFRTFFDGFRNLKLPSQNVVIESTIVDSHPIQFRIRDLYHSRTSLATLSFVDVSLNLLPVNTDTNTILVKPACNDRTNGCARLAAPFIKLCGEVRFGFTNQQTDLFLLAAVEYAGQLYDSSSSDAEYNGPGNYFLHIDPTSSSCLLTNCPTGTEAFQKFNFFSTVSDGNYNQASTWGCGTKPVSAGSFANVFIQNEVVLSNSEANSINSLTIFAEGTLTSNTPAGNNKFVDVASGTNIYGSLLFLKESDLVCRGALVVRNGGILKILDRRWKPESLAVHGDFVQQENALVEVESLSFYASNGATWDVANGLCTGSKKQIAIKGDIDNLVVSNMNFRECSTLLMTGQRKINVVSPTFKPVVFGVNAIQHRGNSAGAGDFYEFNNIGIDLVPHGTNYIYTFPSCKQSAARALGCNRIRAPFIGICGQGLNFNRNQESDAHFDGVVKFSSPSAIVVNTDSEFTSPDLRYFSQGNTATTGKSGFKLFVTVSNLSNDQLSLVQTSENDFDIYSCQ